MAWKKALRDEEAGADHPQRTSCRASRKAKFAEGIAAGSEAIIREITPMTLFA